ncbi:oxygen-dependent tRNA uridine(34) hydroxylase TrhO [Methylobrevis albus]|uniref:tRNA uridine(34) hydroxylase n=1 Tax=Methylobrevis albus TaxID=2793297 RepID=A0A931I2U9_9HYPH|nr:rhodanese-related sulfurtransferase [Methylobrevis albus]MBH0238265.1 rhodanese-related sulfurtransferase [Methylobrevis albus]
MSFTVAALYRFVEIPDPAALRDRLQAVAEAGGVKGTLLVAGEGINGTIAGTDDAVEAVLAALAAEPAFGGRDGLELKYSTAAAMPFGRLKVKVKPEIVTIGDAAADPTRRVGTYVAPEDWNALIADPDVVVLDTRNDFEVRMGRFEGAANPEIERFSEFPAYVDRALDPVRQRRVAMYCTGGIRCEKASALLLARGFDEVFHLKGGILAYLEQVPEAESRWRGDCFVFDERVALGHGLAERPGPRERDAGLQKDEP